MSGGTIHAFDALANPSLEFFPFVAVFGEDRFLQLEVVRHLSKTWIGAESVEFAQTRLDGEEAEWPDVADAIATGSLFSESGRRLVVVDNAHEFVKEHRAALEELLIRTNVSNGLLLCVDSWPANTRLYKLFDKSGLQVDCGPPSTLRGKSKQVDESRILDWLAARARSHYGLELSKAAARQLVELSPCNFGLYDQQLAKLSCAGPPGQPISPENVLEWIGGWRINTVWQAIDAAVDGDAKQALTLLNQLLHAGEHPVALLGQISWSLRRYGEAIELYDRAKREGEPLRLHECLSPAGFRPWGGELQAAEARLRRLGARRSRRLLRWLLETDLALKGSHSHESRGRFALERLIAKLAVSAQPETARRPGTGMPV